MKKIFTLSFMLFTCIVYAQSPASLDPTFNSVGTVSYFVPMETLPQLSCQHKVQPDGKIVICSNSVLISGGTELMITRLNGNGSLDPSFGNSGIYNLSIASGFNLAVGLQLQPDGKIVAAGIFNDGSGINNNEIFILRLHPNGTLDSTFGINGKSQWNFTPENERVTDLKMMNNGSFAISGYIQSSSSSDSSFILKAKANGQLDSSFALNGLFKYQHLGNQTDLYTIDILPNLSIVAAGSYSSATNYQDIFILKLDSNGAFDNTFASAGIYTKDLFQDYDEIHSLKVLPSGEILAAGYTYNGINDGSVVIKINSNGVDVNSFGVNSVSNYTFANTTCRSYAMDIQANGKIVLGGEYADTVSGLSDYFILRLLPNGNPDTLFNSSLPYVVTDFQVEDDHVSSVVIQNDGKILVYGTAIYNSGTQEKLPSLARYLGDAAITVDFNAIRLNQNELCIYPNPFSNYLTLDFEIKEVKPLPLSIINLNGQVIKQLYLPVLEIGKNKVQIDLSELTCGIYFCKLNDGKNVQIVKMSKK